MSFIHQLYDLLLVSLINQPIQPETREQNSLQLHLKRYTFQSTKCGTEGGRGYGGAEQSLFLLFVLYIHI